MIKIIPAILTNDKSEFNKLFALAEGTVDRLQIDILDGKFADNTTITPEILENTNTNLKIDYHLMVEDPEAWVDRCITGKADRIIGQIELMKNQVSFVENIKNKGFSAGLAVDLDTNLDKLDKQALAHVDAVLIMSVKAGFGGQKFNQKALDKIDQLSKIRADNSLEFSILDDGGITFEYIDDVRCEGADEVALGQRIFKGDLKQNLKNFLEAAYE